MTFTIRTGDSPETLQERLGLLNLSLADIEAGAMPLADGPTGNAAGYYRIVKPGDPDYAEVQAGCRQDVLNAIAETESQIAAAALREKK